MEMWCDTTTPHVKLCGTDGGTKCALFEGIYTGGTVCTVTSNDGTGIECTTAAEKDGRNLYVAPIRGKGLWDAIWAYVSIDEDMVIRGIYFNHKAETPGLGANIKQRFFMDDFIGESLLDNEGNFKGVTVSKTNLDPKNEDKYDNEVDAIAGSTITGDGVTAMIRSDLSLYQSYFNSLNNN